jgi:hypothetical protein
MNKKHTTKAQWIDVIGAWEASGQNQKLFCATHGYQYETFCYWRRRIQESGDHTLNQNVQVACYQIVQKPETQTSADHLQLEFETQGIMVPCGSAGLLTINGKLTIEQLARILSACAPRSLSEGNYVQA